MSFFERRAEVALDRPVLVMSLEGWVDAGFGATAASAAIVESMETEVVGVFDTDALLDHRARRPLVRVIDGVNAGLTWPTLTLRAGQDSYGRDVLLLFGPEPDHHWKAFTDEVVAVARSLGVRLVVGLGAFPAPTPHTRPVRLTTTATSSDLAAQVGFMHGAIEVPAGAQAALEEAFGHAGIAAVGLWARVPHYIAAMPYAPASVALVDGLNAIAGLDLAVDELREAAEQSRRRIDELVSQNDEHQALVSQLEAQADAEAMQSDEIPSGDELAAELERFLRQQGDPGSGSA